MTLVQFLPSPGPFEKESTLHLWEQPAFLSCHRKPSSPTWLLTQSELLGLGKADLKREKLDAQQGPTETLGANRSATNLNITFPSREAPLIKGFGYL